MNYLFKNILFSSRIATVYKTNYTKSYDHLEFHPHFELYYCPKAIKQTLTLNGREYIIDKPCVIVTKPYTVHLMQAKDALPQFERYVVYFSKELLELPPWLFNRDLFSRTAIFEDTALSSLEGTVKKIFDTVQENVRCACLIEIFSYLSNITPRFTEEKDNTISPILQYIHERISESLIGDDIAKEFHMSRATLDRLFQKYVGQPLHKTVIDFRLNNAMSLLKYTDKPVFAIAVSCGFENEVYFYSFFKKHVGTSPLKYRKLSRQ